MGRSSTLVVVGAAAVFVPLAASAASADDFFKGKDITLYVGSTSGGPYDAYARMLARHWGRNIPGNPNIVVQNMPGRAAAG
jgi:tripartite-type tricarboxylate transporter receptor subunit TctC